MVLTVEWVESTDRHHFVARLLSWTTITVSAPPDLELPIPEARTPTAPQGTD